MMSLVRCAPWRRCLTGLAAAALAGFGVPAHAVLIHSYDFTSGLTDSVGGADAILTGDAAQTAAGLELNQVSSARDGFASLDTDGDLGNGSGLNLAQYNGLVVDVWATPNAADASLNPNDAFSALLGFGKASTFYTWGAADNYVLVQSHRADDASRGAISNGEMEPWLAESGVNGPELNDGGMHRYTLTINEGMVSFAVDGVDQGSTPLGSNTLANVSDEFARIGSLYAADQLWAGTVQRLDIYAVPEPTAAVLAGLAGLAVAARRR